MSIVGIVIVLIVIGVVLQFVKPYVEPRLFLAAIIIIVLSVCLLILNAVGVFSWGPHLR